MKKTSFILIATAIIGFMLTTCSKSYKEVRIGDQIWMAENLNVDKFRNGDPIPEAKTDEEWIKAGKKGKPAWCYYKKKVVNGYRYGKLYNWYAVNDPRGLAPVGWKIPSDEDWTKLTDFLGGESEAGRKMKFTDFWVNIDDGSADGTNESGFSGLPGGNRCNYGTFYYNGYSGYWWSSTKTNTNNAWFRYLYFNDGIVGRVSYNKGFGFSVRCLSDEFKSSKQIQNTSIPQLKLDYSGNYHGIQPSYYLKNKYGDDMIINGQKVLVPSIDYKFLLKEDGTVSLQLTNLEDNSRVYYDGTIKIINDATDILKLECSLSDGKSSNPTYTLAIKKSDKTANCIGNNEPEFKLDKTK